MNKKFYGALLMGALVMGGAFVSCSDYDDDIKDLQDQINNLNTSSSASVQDVKNQLSTVQSAAAAAQSAADKANAAADAAAKAAKDAAADAAKDAAEKAAAAEAAAMKAADAAIAEAKAETLAAIQEECEEVVKLMEAKADAEQVEIALNLLQGHIESMDEVINQLGDGVAKNAEDIKTLGDQLKALAALKGDQETQAAVLTKYQEKLDELENSFGLVINNVNNRIDINDIRINDLDAAIEDANKAIDAIKDAVASDLVDLTTSVEKALDLVWGKLEEVQNVINDLGEKQVELNTKLGQLSTLNVMLSKKLTSLVFAPTTYRNGIESIEFKTLVYYDWGNTPADWLKDYQNPIYNDRFAGGPVNQYVIDDAGTEVNYYVSPANVDINSIVSYEFLCSEATNTRAANFSPIDVVPGSPTIDGGMLTLKLQKAVTSNLGGASSLTGNFYNPEKFNVVALKATLAKEEGQEEEVAVFSDWARLYETSVRPYIHNAKAFNEDGSLNQWSWGSSYEKTSHFWSFSEVYGAADANPAKTVLPGYHNYNYFVAQNVYYKDTLDLLDLVTVCEYENNTEIKNYKDYGMKFEFNIMDYRLMNEGSTTDDTNQKHFIAKVSDTKVVSRARDGKTPNSRDAIGRQPMIQVVLKDVRDPQDVKVVDVRYLKIKWTDKVNIRTIDFPLGSFNEKYACGVDLENVIKEEMMNKVYTLVDMSRQEFHNTYYLNYDLFATAEDAANANEYKYDYKLGYIQDLYNGQWSENGQTHNLKWAVNTTNQKATQAEYEAGTKVVKAYGYFVNNNNNLDRLIFEIDLTMNIDKMAQKAAYDEPMWITKGEVRRINPQIETNEEYGNATYQTTQILGSFLKGYVLTKDGITTTPTDADQIVNFGNASFVFDKDGLAALATATNTAASDWTIVDNGVTLKYKTAIAAEIKDNKTIQLWESNPGQLGSKPSAGALKLVGQNVPVKVVDTYCDLDQEIDKYVFNIMTPLSYTANAVNVEVTDLAPGGSTSVSFAGKVEIKELFTTSKRIVWDNKLTGSQKNAALIEWYGVTGPTFGEATVNVKNGVIGGGQTKLSEYLENGQPKYAVEVNTTDWTVTYYNKKGDTLNQPIQITIPVEVKTKWQEVIKTNIIVTVKP